MAERPTLFSETLAAEICRRLADGELLCDICRPTRMPSRDTVRRVDRIPAAQGAWYGRLFHAALARNVYLPPSGFEVCFLSMAHDDASLATARQALVDAAVQAGEP